MECISLVADVFSFWNIFSQPRWGYAGKIQIHPLWNEIWEAQFSNLLKPHSGQLTVQLIKQLAISQINILANK